MSFLKRREPERGIYQLPNQSMPPSLKQLSTMLQETLQGRTCQLCFGEPPEDYSLAVFRDRQKGDLHWALYRGQGNMAEMIWDQVASDPGFIHNLITAQFPGFDLKPVARSADLSLQAPNSSGPKSDVVPPGGNLNHNSNYGRVAANQVKPTFEGDLTNLQMANVLQSIAMSRGTGRLELENDRESARVFFADGVPIHCLSNGIEGEKSFLIVMGWDDGKFRFYPEARHNQQTIKRRMDTLLMEGAALDDQVRALNKWGADDNNYLYRTNVGINEVDFENALKKGTGVDYKASKEFYDLIDDRTRLIDILRRCNLAKTEWVPLVFNLVSCNLIAFSEQRPTNGFDDAISDAAIDWSQAEALERLLIRSETQLCSYPAFLMHLKNEFARWERFGRPFSVVLLRLRVSLPESVLQEEPLSIPAVLEVIEWVNRLKRKTDIFAHYETFNFGFLLLETDAIGADIFARRVIN